jgi:hypothetical protein
MTTTANRAGLRSAAKTKRERAAQRTPLPDPIVDRYPPERIQVDRTEGRRTGASRTAVASTTGATPTEATKSGAKALAFQRAVAEFGWSCEFNMQGEVTEVVATRGIEVLFQSWHGGVYQHPATYTVGDRTVLTRNASHAKQYASRPPVEAEAELKRVAENKAFKPREVVPVRKARLPFDPALATDIEIIERIAGKAIKWHNRFTESEESATVGQDPKRIRIEEQGGERVVLFCCPNSGFRAFRVSALRAVGKGSRARRVRDGIES